MIDVEDAQVWDNCRWLAHHRLLLRNGPLSKTSRENIAKFLEAIEDHLVECRRAVR